MEATISGLGSRLSREYGNVLQSPTPAPLMLMSGLQADSCGRFMMGKV